ncbi:hypothetical protein ACOSP7_021045 [Xanthoceras sorbifolium]
MGGRNSDTAGAASTSQRAMTDNSDSVVGLINESTVSSFTGKGLVFMSPKQVIMEECLVQNVQQVERTDLVQNGSNSWQSRFHFKEAWLHDEEAKKIIENN